MTLCLNMAGEKLVYDQGFIGRFVYQEQVFIKRLKNEKNTNLPIPFRSGVVQ